MCGDRCTAGKSVACVSGYWQPQLNQNFADACRKCPDVATSPSASIDIADCVCISGYYDTNHHLDHSNGPTCAVCPIGIDCNFAGSTRFALKLLTGYYRPLNVSVDIRQCPDHGLGNSSACNDGLCAPGLDGIFCELCESNLINHFYVPATKTTIAHCEPCGVQIVGIAIIVAAFALVLIAVALAFRFGGRGAKKVKRVGLSCLDEVRRLWAVHRLANKLKIIINL